MALPRKRRRRIPQGWSYGFDLHDYAQAPSLRNGARQGHDRSIVVTDDWPEQVPISEAELQIIEGHLRKELDELFGPLP